MFRVKDDNIEMNKGDFGTVLTITLDEIQEGSNFKLKVYKEKEILLEKDIKDINGNEVNISLTKEESEKITKGFYKWSLLQYIEDELNNTIIVDKDFEVKAGA